MDSKKTASIDHKNGAINTSANEMRSAVRSAIRLNEGTAVNMVWSVNACSSGLMWQSAGAPEPERGQPDIAPSAFDGIVHPVIPKLPRKTKNIAPMSHA